MAGYKVYLGLNGSDVNRIIKGKDEAPVLSYDPEIEREMEAAIAEEAAAAAVQSEN